MARGTRLTPVRVGSDALTVIERWLADPDPAGAISAAHARGELRGVLPELAAVDGFDQRTPHHPEGDLFAHVLGVLGRLGSECDPDLRWVALLHDLGKPDSCWLDERGVAHYYANPERGREAHEDISARMADDILARLGIAAPRRARIVRLVAAHMRPRFATHRAARRFLHTVGDDADALLAFRCADGEGSDATAQVALMRALCADVRAENQQY